MAAQGLSGEAEQSWAVTLFGPIFLLKNETMVLFGGAGVAISQDDN